ncbi:MAG: IS5 family transposase [Nitrosopumilus sp.]|nr:IS5 family transposase [Nitrosopumilus sp.]
MFNYKSKKQLSLFEFKTGFEGELDPKNRWIKLSESIDWDRLVEVYAQKMHPKQGARSIDGRIVLGALLIKHIENLSDRGTISAIQENPYMQFFLGLESFTFKPVFDPSLFVYIRKRLGKEEFEKMNQVIIDKALNRKSDKDDEQDSDQSSNQNKGKVQLDATVADAEVNYPTDIKLLNDCREKAEQIIDYFYETYALGKKPRTYRRVAKKEFLSISKNKNVSKSKLRKAKRKQLGYLKRDFGYINNLLENNLVNFRDGSMYRYWLVIQQVYQQQKTMFDNKVNRVDNRIISIHQPHVRPIVRGKSGRKVEFGAKINLQLQSGYASIDQISFNAFNEGICLEQQVQNYRKSNGHFPELIQADKIYLNRENRAWMKQNGIRHTGQPLGRPKKQKLSKFERQKQKKECNERNQIEGFFGTAKRKYALNNIKAKKANTSESWIYAIILSMNILKLSKDIFWQIFYTLKSFKFSFQTQILIKKFHFQTQFEIS